MKKKMISPGEYPKKCEYCKFGRLSPDEKTILCSKKGITERDSNCKSYKYDVFKRMPMKKPIVESADPSDFEL